VRLIFGLGNPGKRFFSSRHNLGSISVRELAKRFKIKLREKKNLLSLVGEGEIQKKDVILALPLEFMNICGIVIKRLKEYYNIDLKDILVILDDMDLERGKIRFRLKGSDAGHKGLRSVIENLRTENFSRLKIGIGRPPEGVNPSDYVLERFSKLEFEEIKSSLERMISFVESWLERSQAC